MAGSQKHVGSLLLLSAQETQIAIRLPILLMVVEVPGIWEVAALRSESPRGRPYEITQRLSTSSCSQPFLTNENESWPRTYK